MTTTDRAEVFEALRPRLFGIGYRMTGSVADGEDIAQEAWLRWQRSDDAEIESPEGWLVRVATNLAIDRSRAVQRRRETYVGPYLPEPLLGEPLSDGRPASVDPAARSELADSLTFAFLVLLDELDPTARAVFLLHDVFGYPFEQIAAMVGRTSAACRQIASRTRRRLDHERVELRRASEEHERRVVHELVGALFEGDLDRVLALLAPDVVQLDDGGPNRHAGRRPIVGPERVARLLVNLSKRMPPAATIDLVRVNDDPGIVVRVDGRPDVVITIGFAPDGRVRRIYSQLNPDKLAHLT